jgi:hypothetical protein
MNADLAPRLASERRALPSINPGYWSYERLAKAERTLMHRANDIRADIARELGRYGAEHLLLVAGDALKAEILLADVIGNVCVSKISGDIDDLRELESAIARIRSGTYGECIDCGQAFDPLRLHFSPAAARCMYCQENAKRDVGP